MFSTLALIASTLFAAQPARADAEPSLDPRVAITSEALETPAPASVPDPNDRLLRRDMRRSRALLMIGSGLLAASIVHVAAFSFLAVVVRPVVSLAG